MKMKKEKKESQTFKLSQYDRVQGLTRNTRFLEDLKTTIYPFPNKPNTKGFSIQKERDFYNRYGITLPPNYSYQTLEQCVEIIRKNVVDIGFETEWSVRLLPVEDAKFIAVDGHDRKRSLARGKIFEYNKHPFIRDGKYISVEIDLTKDITELENTFKNIIRGLAKNVKKSNQRTTSPRSLPNGVTIWSIYNQHEINGLSLSEIARNLSGIKGAPQRDPQLQACYKSVIYAYKKAQQIIVAITK